jgi:hypothetical protein
MAQLSLCIPAVRAIIPVCALCRNHDPSCIAFGHGNGGFDRRASHGHAALLDNAALPVVGCYGVHLVHRSQNNRSGLDHIAHTRGQECGIAHTDTVYTTLRRYSRQHRPTAFHCRGQRLSVFAGEMVTWRFSLIGGVPKTGVQVRSEGVRETRTSFETLIAFRTNAATAIVAHPNGLWTCGQRKSVAHKPTGPKAAASFNLVNGKRGPLGHHYQKSTGLSPPSTASFQTQAAIFARFLTTIHTRRPRAMNRESCARRAWL